MKKHFWSLGSLLALTVIIGSFGLVCFVTQRWWGGEIAPAFSDLTSFSGEVVKLEFIDLYDSDSHIYDHDIYIWLRSYPTRYQDLEPHEHEVYQVLKGGSTVELWVDHTEVWHVATDGEVVSSYEARAAWGKSNDSFGKVFVSLLIALFLDFMR